MTQSCGGSPVLLWHYLEGIVLGFHCKASNLPTKSRNSVRILGLLISVSQKPKGSTPTNDIFTLMLVLGDQKTNTKIWPRLAPRVLVLPGAIWKPGREQVCELVTLTWEKGWKLRTLSKVPGKTSITGCALMETHTLDNAPQTSPFHSTILAKEHILPAQFSQYGYTAFYWPVNTHCISEEDLQTLCKWYFVGLWLKAKNWSTALVHRRS